MSSPRPANIPVSTTPSLDGWDIDEYLGVATAHVVAGTNVFSDIAGSFSDIFGGQSKSYQKQLASINDAALKDLRQQAAEKGGTAIVGLSVDHDQISGGNRQLFMVTATATVVRAERSEDAPRSDQETGEGGPVSARQVEVDRRTRRLVAAAEEGSVRLGDDRWEFLIRNQVTELAPFIRDSVNNMLNQPVLSKKKKRFVRRAEDYFGALPEPSAKHHLYNLLGRGNAAAAEWALGRIEERRLLDWYWAGQLLKSDVFEIQKRVLPALARADKPSYSKSDIEDIGRLIETIENRFSKRGEVVEVDKGGVFSSGTQKVWRLEEDRDIPMDQEYDPVTGKDIYGFTEEETRPEEAIRALSETRAVLMERFEG
jgi:uncharacterized protein YbjQ (UPF0145 family)